LTEGIGVELKAIMPAHTGIRDNPDPAPLVNTTRCVYGYSTTARVTRRHCSPCSGPHGIWSWVECNETGQPFDFRG